MVLPGELNTRPPLTNGGTHRPSIVFEKPPSVHTKPFGDAPNIVDRDIPFRALHSAKIRAIQSAIVSERLLCEAANGT